MSNVRMVAASLLALSLASAMPAVAQDNQAPCTTKSECDLRADLRDIEARQATAAANAKREQDYAAQRQALSAQARAKTESGKLTRVEDVMRRRREAAAAAGN